MKKILLTGPTGSVGFETLKKLINSDINYKIKILELKTKKNIKKLKPYSKQVEIIWGNICKSEITDKAISDVDAVIHTAAIIPPKADEYPDLAYKVNFEGTENLVDSILTHNPDIFLVYTSSISVYGDRVKNPEISIFDNLKPSTGDYYAVTKIRAEEYIKHKLRNFTIFRLSAVMDIKMKLDPLFFHMPLNTALEIVTSGDVASALVKSLEKKELLNERIFNLGGGKNCRISYKDFLDQNFKALGLQKLTFPEYAFAEKNFHCGYYKDSQQLNNILDFQKETLNDYLNNVKKRTNFIKKLLIQILRPLILKNLLRRSDPYNAYINNNIELIKHYFKKSPYSFS